MEGSAFILPRLWSKSSIGGDTSTLLGNRGATPVVYLIRRLRDLVDDPQDFERVSIVLNSSAIAEAPER